MLEIIFYPNFFLVSRHSNHNYILIWKEKNTSTTQYILYFSIWSRHALHKYSLLSLLIYFNNTSYYFSFNSLECVDFWDQSRELMVCKLDPEECKKRLLISLWDLKEIRRRAKRFFRLSGVLKYLLLWLKQICFLIQDVFYCSYSCSNRLSSWPKQERR